MLPVEGMSLSLRRTIVLVLAGAAALGVGAAISCNSDDSISHIVDLGGDASDASGPVKVQILGINDFHGNIDPPTGKSALVLAAAGDPEAGDGGAATDAGTQNVNAGGVVYLAAHLNALKAQNPNTAIVSSGDLTGASPFVSQAFHDEDSVELMNAIGLDFNGVGNHEFDHGVAELLRLQRGGCYGGTCDGGADASTFTGAKFEYLAANVEVAKNQTVFPPYAIKELGGQKIAFIGMTLKDTPSVTLPSSVVGLTFDDEVTTVNALVPEIRQQGASAIVVLLHQGDFPAANSTYNGCGVGDGVLATIANGLDPAVDVVLSAHTHQAYNCTIAGKLVTSAASFGRVITQVELTIDPAQQRVIDKHATNHIVTRDIAPDPAVAAMVQSYEQRIAPIANKVVGHIAGSGQLTAGDGASESTLGDVIADSMMAATSGAPFNAEFAVTNPGGIRTDLPTSSVTYQQAFTVLPFGNYLMTVSLTGAQIQTMLDEQFADPKQPKILQLSKELSWKRSGSTVDKTSITIKGAPLSPTTTYRVTTNNFVASGGDGFTVFKQATNATSGTTTVVDLDALTSYFARFEPGGITPPTLNRIQ